MVSRQPAVSNCHMMIEYTLPRSHAPSGSKLAFDVAELIINIIRHSSPRVAMNLEMLRYHRRPPTVARLRNRSEWLRCLRQSPAQRRRDAVFRCAEFLSRYCRRHSRRLSPKTFGPFDCWGRPRSAALLERTEGPAGRTLYASSRTAGS